MSQKKVDLYKANKVNKEKILKREKLITRIECTAAIVVIVALLAWFGWSVFDKVTNPSGGPAAEYTLDTTSLDEYLSGLEQ